MPVINSIAARLPYFAAFRQKLHQMPELGFETVKTAAMITKELERIGVDEIHQGFAKNGVIAIINGKSAGKVIGLRADMDALPIIEETGKSYASQIPGVMHACGHDGHSTTLLAAAEHLAETRDFIGKVVLIFQPAEEGGGGAGVMVKEGVLERFGIEEIYALHNIPGQKFGTFEICKGPIMAATNSFDIKVIGRGGHAATPEKCIDPIPVAMRLIDSIYTIKSRGLGALDAAVISVTQFHAGSAENIIPSEVFLQGTIRTLSKSTQKIICSEMKRLVEMLPTAYLAQGTLNIHDGYPATDNHGEKASYAYEVAKEILGESNASIDAKPVMGAEDFAFFLEKIPGAYGFFGAGEGPGLHNEKFDFNDGLIPIGASWFVGLVKGAN